MPGSVSASTSLHGLRLHHVFVAQQLGQAEVHHLHVAPLGHENVRGLDIAMHDALRVRGVQRVGDLDPEIDNLVNLEHAAGQSIVERLAFHPFHDDERLALVFADVVDRADVRVVQRGGGSRLDAKPLNGLAVSHQFLWDELERDLPAETIVLSAVDDAHAAGAELMRDPIVRNGFADHADVMLRTNTMG